MELEVRATARNGGGAALLSAVRWLSLLPSEWRPELLELSPADQPTDASIVVRLTHDVDVSVEQVRTSAVNALQDPALRGWELVACRQVA